VLLILTALLPLGCGGRYALPEGWLGHCYKLLEHPESFAGKADALKLATGYFTYNIDTREAVRIGVSKALSFDVFLPSEGKLKFAYGFGNELSGYAPEVTLTVKAEAEGIDAELESLKISTKDEDKAGHWSDASIAFPADVSGYMRLTFSLAGPKDAQPGGVMLIAHPTIVAPDKAGKFKRVIWISIDTLRPDHLGCYGYQRPTSPNIDAFAKEATLFEYCLTPGAWTFPSYAAMFTGKYPSITGSTTNMQRLPPSERTLAELISATDMATFSVQNIPWAGTQSGLNRGFDTCKLFWNEYADVSLEYSRKWLAQHADEDVFMFIHLFDPHVPYNPKDKFFGTFDPGYKGGYKRTVIGLEHISEGKAKLSDAERNHIIALYDEDILGCDEDVGNFLKFLKENDIYSDSLIIINSDHGEEFGEHGKYEHGHQLYNESLLVPMIIRGPGYDKGKRIKGMCADFDIFPTILEWLKIEVSEGLNAVSLNNLMKGQVEKEKRWLLSEQMLTGVEQKAVSTDKYRYIFHTLDGKEELYDVTEDPLLLADISAQRNATSRNFRYFVREYTLNQGTGWHVRISRGKVDWAGEPFYEGKIIVPSGFVDVKRTQLGDKDEFEQNGNELTFRISIGQYNYKAFDFTTNDENDRVLFEVASPNNPNPNNFVFIGPELTPMPDNSFTLCILDPIFGLGMPQFLQSPGHDGLHIWGNSKTLHEKVTPEIDKETVEALKSLGYLQ